MSELEIFVAAIAMNDPAERTAFLDRVCDNQPELRARLDHLLAAHAQNASPIDSPPLAAAAFAATASVSGLSSSETSPDESWANRHEEIGTILAGRYKLVELIGEGGMGSVYLAEQSEPVRRQVAIKLIKNGMDSKRVLTRFDAERQALAMMDHPNIAKVFDGGTTERGHPFFVMELVRGKTLTHYCDRQRFSVKSRLELFVQVCQAVQHAHQKGIIHRDLKPGNILVTEVDGLPTPKVIDFGVAKATEQSLSAQSLAETAAIVGTPAYMSPEQADPTSMDIDTRTDVYALGVVLYELLTGSPPIDVRQFKRAAFLEMLRMVREVDPPRPSTKISSADALPNIAANRDIEPSRLTKLLQGELDWVVMKAIEKDRTRRYDTANGLARDIQRYLADEVVEARPPSTGYRLKKFVRRNKGRVLAASLVVLALIGGIIGTSIGLVRADAHRRRAVEAETQAVDQRNKAVAAAEAEKQAKLRVDEERRRAVEAESTAVTERNKAVAAANAEKVARVEAEKERLKAEKARETTAEQRRLALDTVRDVLLRVDDLMKNDAKLAPLRVEIIRRMLEDVDRIRDHAVRNPLIERTEGIAYFRMGELYFKTNRIKDAVEWLGKSHSIFRKQLDESPKDPNAMRNYGWICKQLAEAEWRMGAGLRSRSLHAEALQIRQARRDVLEQQKAEEIELTSAASDIAESLHLLAYDDLRMGDPVRAIENYQRSDRAYQDLPLPMGSTLRVRRIRYEILVRLADAHSRLTDFVRAEELYRRALGERESLAQMTTRPRAMAILISTDVGQSHMYLGDFFLMCKKDLVAAEREYEACRKIFVEGLKEEPDSLDLAQRLAATHYRLGIVAEQSTAYSFFAGSSPRVGLQVYHYTESQRLRESLAKIDPKDSTTQVEYLLSLARLGERERVERLASNLMDFAGKDPQTLFQIACAYAILSAGNDEAAARNRETTFKVLAQLQRSGWKDPEAFMLDPDFATIRQNPQFQEFVKKMPKPERPKVVDHPNK